MINVIVAVEKNFGIGKDGKLPWNNKEELQIFKQKTLNSILIYSTQANELFYAVPETQNHHN